MSNIRINPIPIFSVTAANSSSLGYPGSGGNKSDNKDNDSSQTFKDIFKQMLEKQA